MTYRYAKRSTRRKIARSSHTMAVLICVLVLTGCAVGPDYQAPEMSVPQNWTTADDPALLPRGDLIQHWWTLFNDPLLDGLIQSAKKNNRDLMAAIARVEEARALLGHPTCDTAAQ